MKVIQCAIAAIVVGTLCFASASVAVPRTFLGFTASGHKCCGRDRCWCTRRAEACPLNSKPGSSSRYRGRWTKNRRGLNSQEARAA